MVTRPAGQSAGLARLIETVGGSALRFPLIEIEPARSAGLEALIDSLDSADLAIFISRNAAEQGLKQVRARRAWPAGLAAAAVGPGTRRALEALGLDSAFSPDGQADSEALLGHPRLAAVSGKRIVIFRGEGGREELAVKLRERGARVEYAECYRRTLPSGGPGALAGHLAGGKVDAVVVSSGEGLRNLMRILGAGAVETLAGTILFVPHRRVAEQAVALGVANAVVGGPGDEDMLAALVAHFCNAG